MALRMIRGTAEQTDRNASRPRLRVVSGARHSARPHVVAELLSDGTIRPRDGSAGWETGSKSGWRQGSLAGDGWTLWWERRPWSAA
jgi:hypothetical protein